METVLSSLVWATGATLIAQAVAIGIMWYLGLPPKKLAHEIEDVQNPAIGATFFIVSIIASIFIGLMAQEPSPAESNLASAAWILGGIALATLYSGISFIIVHRIFEPIEGENVYTWIRRELVLEQNASLAFFLGGLSVAHFISVAYQVI